MHIVYVAHDTINTKSQSQVAWKWMSQPQYPKVLRRLEVLSGFQVTRRLSESLAIDSEVAVRKISRMILDGL